MWMIACFLVAISVNAEDLSLTSEEVRWEEQVYFQEETPLCQEQCVDEAICEEQIKRWGVEGRVAWYYPLSGETRTFYDSPMLGYQLEGMYRLCGRWQLFARATYVEKKGSAEIEVYGDSSATHFYCPRLVLDSFDKHIRMRVLQGGVGVQYEWELPCSFSVGLGAGVTYSWLWHKHGVEESHYSGYSWYSVGSKNEGMDHAFGGLIKAHLGYDLTRCIRTTLFVDYSVTKFSQHDFDFSTIAGGLGIGVYF